MNITTILTIVALLVVAIFIIVEMIKEIRAIRRRKDTVPLYFPNDKEWFEEFTSYLIAAAEHQDDEEYILAEFEIYMMYVATYLKIDRYEAAEFLLKVAEECSKVDLNNSEE